MTQRLNARIDDELALKLERLRQLSGKDTTEIICASIESYYEFVMRRAQPLHLLQDFIGSGNGDGDLSRDYKKELNKSLNQKFGA